jgi:hypothetical protein
MRTKRSKAKRRMRINGKPNKRQLLYCKPAGGFLTERECSFKQSCLTWEVRKMTDKPWSTPTPPKEPKETKKGTKKAQGTKATEKK